MDKCNDTYNFYKNYYVSLKDEPIELEGCIIRNLVIRYNPNRNNSKDSNEPIREYQFTQYHLTNWPDHGVPNNIDSIIKIIDRVRDNMFENNRIVNENLNKSGNSVYKNVSPLSNDYLAVHCSAGCGRTGTIIAVDQVWTLLNENVIFIFCIFFLAKTLFFF